MRLAPRNGVTPSAKERGAAPDRAFVGIPGFHPQPIGFSRHAQVRSVGTAAGRDEKLRLSASAAERVRARCRCVSKREAVLLIAEVALRADGPSPSRIEEDFLCDVIRQRRADRGVDGQPHPNRRQEGARIQLAHVRLIQILPIEPGGRSCGPGSDRARRAVISKRRTRLGIDGSTGVQVRRANAGLGLPSLTQAHAVVAEGGNVPQIRRVLHGRSKQVEILRFRIEDQSRIVQVILQVGGEIHGAQIKSAFQQPRLDAHLHLMAPVGVVERPFDRHGRDPVAVLRRHGGQPVQPSGTITDYDVKAVDAFIGVSEAVTACAELHAGEGSAAQNGIVSDLRQSIGPGVIVRDRKISRSKRRLPRSG